MITEHELTKAFALGGDALQKAVHSFIDDTRDLAARVNALEAQEVPAPSTSYHTVEKWQDDPRAVERHSVDPLLLAQHLAKRGLR